MTNEERYFEASRFNESVHRLISAVLVGLMMGAAGIVVAQIGHKVVPSWHGMYLAAIGFLIALERFYSHRALTKTTSFSREWIVLISTQWVVNLIGIKLVVTLSNGLDALLAEIPLWQRSFGERFLSADFVVAVIFAILVWIFVGMSTQLLDEMGLDAAMIAREVMSSIVKDQAPPGRRLMAAVFALGGGLMFLTALARVDTRALFANEPGALRTDLSTLEAGGAGTLLYFLFGMALLSQARYITLNTRWYLQKVPISRSIAANWAIYSISFLVLIVLVVSVLPTSYSLGLLSVLGYLLDIIIGILFFITSLILIVISFILSLPFLLFRMDPPVEMPAIATPPPVEPPPSPVLTESTGFPWLDLLKSVLFWGFFLAVVGYSIAQYLRQHEEILQQLRKIPGWSLLASFWRWITGVFGGLNQRVSDAIQAGRARFSSPGESGNLGSFRRLLSLRGLSSRQRVFFYYQALLRRGDETGLPRKESQTPDEYAGRLERSLPTVKEDILSLTESFIEARYTRHPIEAKDASKVKAQWERIRQVFRGRRG